MDSEETEFGKASGSGPAPTRSSVPHVEVPPPAPILDCYEILGELGWHGGRYKARDRETGDVVALKLLLPEIAARPDLIECFKAELRLARKITHKIESPSF